MSRDFNEGVRGNACPPSEFEYNFLLFMHIKYFKSEIIAYILDKS